MSKVQPSSRSRSATRSRTTSTRCATCAWSRSRPTTAWSAGANRSPSSPRRTSRSRRSSRAWPSGSSARTRSTTSRSGTRCATRRGGTATAAASRATPSPPSTSRCGTSRASCSACRVAPAARRRRPREAAGRRVQPRPLRGHRADGRGGPGVGRARACTASRSASASAATRASATSTIATSSTCAQMREGLGPDQLIMIDCGWNVKWDVTTAVRRVQAFDEYDLHWIEEPLGAWDPEGYANLRSKTTDAHRLRREGVERRRASSGCSATGTVDVVGVDPGRAEGITGFKRAAERIEFYRRQANAHCWSSAIVHRREPGDELQLAGVQAHRGQAAAQPDAARAGARAVRARRRLVLSADRSRASASRCIDEVVDRYRSEKVLACARALEPAEAPERTDDMERRRRARGHAASS